MLLKLVGVGWWWALLEALFTQTLVDCLKTGSREYLPHSLSRSSFPCLPLFCYSLLGAREVLEGHTEFGSESNRTGTTVLGHFVLLSQLEA